MLRGFFEKKFCNKKRALSLVEIVVAIGISAITLTTSSAFSTALMIKAQQNFMDDSVVQLVNIIVEQLRFAESEMQQVKIRRSAGENNLKPAVFDTQYDWQNFCINNANYSNLFVDIPNVIGAQGHNVKIGFLQDQTTNVETINVEGVYYMFQNITEEKLMGAFYTGSSSAIQKVGVGIRKDITNTPAIGEVINLSIVVRYYLFNIQTPQYTKYSRPTTVKMVKSTVC